MKKSIYIFLTIIITASCAVRYTRPDIDTDNIVRNNDPADTTFDINNLNWREFYQDSILCDLIDSALVNNYDLQIAYRRIEQAASYFKQSRWGYAPKLGADAGASYQKPDLVSPETPYFTLGLSASWEIDIWGKLTQAKRSRFEKLLAQENAKNAIVTQLIANIAEAYFNLIAFDTEKRFVLETIENRENYLQTVKDLKESAEVNEIAVLQAESQLILAQSYIPQINKSIRQTENALCLLLGESPHNIERSHITNLFGALSEIDSVGIPANLLRNRPDVIAAEHTLKSYMYNYNSAVAAMYPSLTLSGNISSDAANINQWFAMPSSLLWGVVGGLMQPIFNGRALRTQKEAAYQEYEAGILEFKKTVLQAGMEVSNAMYAVKSDKELVRLTYKQYKALEKAYDYSYELLINGYATYLDVLSAQEGVFNTQISLIKSLINVIDDNIGLYRALGGGWNHTENDKK